MLRRNYEGMGGCKRKKTLSDLYYCVDFAAHGQDAITMVFSSFLDPVYTLKPVISELAALPRPERTILLADAVAIKVRSFYFRSIQNLRCLQPGS